MKKTKKFFTVYQIKNLVDGKIYVGAHATNKLNDNYWGSSKYLTNDIKKLGKENFEKRILYVFDNVEDMKNKEAEIVTKGWCISSDTYNRIVGGLESFTTIGMVTVKNPEGGYMNVYKEDSRWLSGELEASTKGNTWLKERLENNEELKTFYRNKFIGHLKEAHKKGKIRYDTFKGKNHSEDTKKIMRDRASERIGEKNSQYETCWVTNGSENKKIKKENLEEWLNKGYLRGRK